MTRETHADPTSAEAAYQRRQPKSKGEGRRLTDKLRLEILAIVDAKAGVTNGEIGGCYDISEAAVRRLKRNRAHVLRRYALGHEKVRDLRCRGVKADAPFNEEICQYIMDHPDASSSWEIRRKARLIAPRYNKHEFFASYGWYTHFAKQYDIPKLRELGLAKRKADEEQGQKTIAANDEQSGKKSLPKRLRVQIKVESESESELDDSPPTKRAKDFDTTSTADATAATEVEESANEASNEEQVDGTPTEGQESEAASATEDDEDDEEVDETPLDVQQAMAATEDAESDESSLEEVDETPLELQVAADETAATEDESSLDEEVDETPLEVLQSTAAARGNESPQDLESDDLDGEDEETQMPHEARRTAEASPSFEDDESDDDDEAIWAEQTAAAARARLSSDDNDSSSDEQSDVEMNGS
ncbi:hypothetical protein LEN26_016342 [Aphanomyces euteiches]|nr:hypothetical protein LEN26_016342 [Aphanomyces euteiches]